MKDLVRELREAIMIWARFGLVIVLAMCGLVAVILPVSEYLGAVAATALGFALGFWWRSVEGEYERRSGK